MAGTVTFAGIGSGIDVESLITGLVNANKVTLNAYQTKASNLRSAASTLSDIGKALATLKSAADALSSAQGVASFSATSSDSSSIVASAAGNAQAGAYAVTVEEIAKEQRTYSATFASSSDPLDQAGQFTIGIGQNAATVTVNATDSLGAIASKINASGMRVSASVFYDGTAYRLQVRGLDTGAANAVTFTENGTALDLNGTGATPGAGKTVQPASDARLTVDGFPVNRPTNQIVGVLPGITFAVSQKTTTPVTVTVGSDPTALTSKVKAVVSAYNAVVNQIHTVAGYGTQKARSQTLAGDSALRQLAGQLGQTVAAGQSGQGLFATLAQIGLSQTRDGTLQLDETKLAAALTQDPDDVEKLLGRQTGASTGGFMAALRDLADAATVTGTGALALRQKSFTDQAAKLDDDATAEQSRLDDYADRLRKQFTVMDTTVSANQALLSQLNKIG
jgi:flagellar hook-associated protein 2